MTRAWFLLLPIFFLTVKVAGAQSKDWQAEWEKIVSLVRASHHRKMGFMSGFENLIAGAGPSTPPSFLERAKAKWSERQQKNRP